MEDIVVVCWKCRKQLFPPNAVIVVFSLHDGKFGPNHSFGVIFFVWKCCQSTRANSIAANSSSQDYSYIQVFSHFVFGQVKPVRLSSLEVSKVTFPSAFKGLINEDTNVDNLPFSRSLAAKNNEISERASPKELPLVQWVQDYASPPPRWFCTRLRVMTIVMVGENVEIMWMIMWMMMMKGLS